MRVPVGLAAVVAAVSLAATVASPPGGIHPDGTPAAPRPPGRAPVRAAPGGLLAMGFDAEAYGAALAAEQELPPRPVPGARVVLVPHHWPAARLIVAGLRDLAAGGPWSRVVILGPDHRRASRRPAMTSERHWAVGGRRVDPDAGVVRRLVSGGAASDQPAALAAEHGVAGLVPAVADLFPSALVVPVAVRSDASRAETIRLASAIGPLDDRTAVVLSVDLAHGLSPERTRANDAATLAAFAALDAETLRAWGDEHLDARGAAPVAIALARRLGATELVLRARADGGSLPGYAGGAVTGYVVGFYVRPERR